MFARARRGRFEKRSQDETDPGSHGADRTGPNLQRAAALLRRAPRPAPPPRPPRSAPRARRRDHWPAEPGSAAVTLPDLIAQMCRFWCHRLVYLIVLRPQQRAQKEKVKQLGTSDAAYSRHVERAHRQVTKSSTMPNSRSRSPECAQSHAAQRHRRGALEGRAGQGSGAVGQELTARDPAPSLRSNPDSTAIGKQCCVSPNGNRRDSGDDVLRDACRRAKSADAVNYEALGASSGLGAAATIVLGLDLQGAPRHAGGRQTSVLHTLAMNLPRRARRILAREKVARRAHRATDARRADAIRTPRPRQGHPS